MLNDKHYEEAGRAVTDLLGQAAEGERTAEALSWLLKILRRVLTHLVRLGKAEAVKDLLHSLVPLKSRYSENEWGCFHSRLLDNMVKDGWTGVLAEVETHIMQQGLHTNIMVLSRLMILKLKANQLQETVGLFEGLKGEV